MLLRACRLQAIPISRRVTPSFARRALATDSTTSDASPAVSSTSSRDEILQSRLLRFAESYTRILREENPDAAFEMLPRSLDEIPESERDAANEWLARLEQVYHGDAVTDVALPVDNTAVTTEAEAEAAADVVPVESPGTGILAADVISGAPSQLRHRVVRVYQPTRNTMQSGGAKGERWRIDWDILQGGGRWENPLMGWASSADYMQGTRLTFKSQEDAIHFAKKQGWDYYVQSPTVKRIPPKNYSENYLYRSQKLRIAKTK
ncbi:ETC complex I subunit conserved region-domain-containing protein [Mycena filopes]|nr:ETC complex I subunit conserved region-domain-containing protein [Mycena filopes]